MQSNLRRLVARARFCKQRAAAIAIESGARRARAVRRTRRLRAAVRIQTRTRALIARRHVDATRRHARATTIQSTSRMRSKRLRLRAMRRACLRLQSHRRMVCQRRQYRRDLAEKKEEAKLSNQLMKMQARDCCVITA